MYISPERKVSSVKGTGIQYIPGHVEDFVDLVVEKYLSTSGHILDLGGGGFRFAVPVALKGKSITVVDLDKQALDLAEIITRVNQNDRLSVSFESLNSLISTEAANIFDYLRVSDKHYGLISAFRVIHFLSPKLISELFSLVYDKLEIHGVFVLSAMTPYNFSDTSEFNEIFTHSHPLNHQDELYRAFDDSPQAKMVREQQNLPEHFHLVTEEFIRDKAQDHNFEVLESSARSTRIVDGYILRKS